MYKINGRMPSFLRRIIQWIAFYSLVTMTYSMFPTYGDKELPRGVVFPPATVFQVAFGLAVPAQVTNRSVFTNLGMISNIPMPSKISDFYALTSGHRDFTHNYVYNVIQEVLNAYNLNGKECVLKTICQMSGVNLEPDDKTHQILELLFLPSSTKNVVAERDYLMAEQIGRQPNVKCAKEYPLCKSSILDLISEDPLP